LRRIKLREKSKGKNKNHQEFIRVCSIYDDVTIRNQEINTRSCHLPSVKKVRQAQCWHVDEGDISKMIE